MYWFFTSLSETYVYETNFKLNYHNVPDDLLFQKANLKEVTAQIEASGFEILSQKINKIEIDLDVSKFTKADEAYKYYFEINREKHNLQKQISDARIIEFSIDTVFIYLGKLKTKKVPVVSKVELFFKSGYKQRESITIKPDSVDIKGPEKIIDSIQFINTIPKVFKNLNKDFSLNISLDVSELKPNELSIKQTQVELIAEITKFTEGRIELNIKPPQISKNISLELFPKKATLIYEVAFDKYQEVNKSSFEISFLPPKENDAEVMYLDLILFKKPNFIKNYSIEPKQVKFLTQQKKK
jgi:YbbR domain-containing protein